MSTPQGFRPIRRRLADARDFWKPKLDRAAFWLIFACLAAAMLFDPARDTMQVAGAAFAVTLALAAVTFSYAKTLDGGSAIYDELIFAGEKLVIGATLFLFASILKHASHDLPRHVDRLLAAVEPPNKAGSPFTLYGFNIFEVMFASIAFMTFLVGLFRAQTGIQILSACAIQRMKRRPGRDDSFVTAKSSARRVAELEESDGRDRAEKPGSRVVAGTTRANGDDPDRR